jgi:tRNA-Thr(GGU) m(6)t(6)A37 methyltransferase TsaA
MSSEESIKMKPIGFVRTQAVCDEVKDKSRTSEIVVNPELAQALEGITGFSHLFVLFWLSEISTEQRKMLKVYPRGRRDLPLLGVFATRTNLRPNPIGLTLVELVNVKGNVLTVRGLDAFNGTPVLDIKPYDFWDVAKDAKVPKWWAKLESEKLGSLKSEFCSEPFRSLHTS